MGGFICVAKQEKESEMSVQSFFQLKAQDIDDRWAQFSTLKTKKAILIINIGLDGLKPVEEQIKELANIYKQFKDIGLEVLLFPCEGEGETKLVAQDLKAQIKDICGMEFLVFSKVEVNGPNANEVFKFLKRNSPLYDPRTGVTGNIKGSFYKFVVNGAGAVVEYGDPATPPSKMTTKILKLLVS